MDKLVESAWNIKPDIEAIENNSELYRDLNFDDRVEAIDFIEFNVIDRIEGLLQTANSPEDLLSLKQNAERVKRRLEEIDEDMFQRLRSNIRMGYFTGPTFKDLIAQYTRIRSGNSHSFDAIGYDNLDILINGLLFNQALPTPTMALEPEMYFYQQTPARLIFELIDQAHMTKDDVFYDLGSGLGHVPILVNLMTGATARGIEYEPAYCSYARTCAKDLNLSQPEFINADVRSADFSQGTVFFMYTPFVGKILQEVLEKLKSVSCQRKIKLFTYGPCTPQVSRQSWLMSENPNQINQLSMYWSL